MGLLLGQSTTKSNQTSRKFILGSQISKPQDSSVNSDMLRTENLPARQQMAREMPQPNIVQPETPVEQSTTEKLLEAAKMLPSYFADKTKQEPSRQMGQKVLGEVTRPLDSARNAVASTIKEASTFEKFDPINNTPKLGKAFVEGLTGKRETSTAEVMPEFYKKWSEEHPALSFLPNLVLDIVSDPTTYVGGGGLLKISKAIETKLGRKLATNAEKQAVKELAEKAAVDKGIDLDLQNEITTPNPQQSEQIAEELRGLKKQPNDYMELKKQVQDYAKEKPDEVAKLIRSWLSDDTPTVSVKPVETKINDGNIQTPSTVEKRSVTSQQFTEEYTKSLPDTEPELQSTIAKIKEKLATADEPTKRRLNLQLFAAEEKLKKISQFRTNTIERSTMLTDEEKGFLPEKDFEFDAEKSANWEKQAVLNVRQNLDTTKENILKSKQLDDVQEYEAAIIATQLRDKARKLKEETGSLEGYGELSKWLSTTSAKTREVARALKAVDLAWDKTTPEAGIKQSQKIIDGVEEAIKKTQPDKIRKIDEGVQKIKDILDSNLTPQEMMNRIKAIINPNNKAGKVTFDKLMEIINKGKAEGKVDFDAVRNILKEKDKIPVLTNDDIAQIDSFYTKAKEFAPDSYENRMYIEKARKLVEDKMPTDIVDKYRVIQRISMIFNPKTLITRNPGGNILLMSLTQIKENTLGAFVDMLTSAIRGSERTTLFAPITKGKAMLKGAGKGLKEWGQDIKNNVDTNPTHGQMELQKGTAFKGNDPISRVINAIDTIEKRALQLGDRPGYEAAYASRIAELKKIKKTSTISDDMKLDAKAYALDKVFQRDSELAKIFGGAKNLSQNVGFKILANTIMPFTQTPANVLDKMLEYGPVGIGKAIFNSKKNGVFNQKYFVDNLASGLTGTGILTLGYFMAKNNMISGKADTSGKAKDFKSASGQANYALKFGNQYYTIDWAQPVATMLLAGAEMFKGGQKGDDAFKQVLNTITAGGDTFFNMSMLKNVSGLFGSGNSPAGSLINTLMGSTTQFTPTMGKQIAQLIDPYIRETYDPNMLKEQYNKILAKLPGLSMTLPIKTDTMGQDIKAFQGENNVLNVMFNPGFGTNEVNDPVRNELMRLYEREKNTDLLPSAIQKTISYEKQDYTFTTEEFTQFKKRYGELILNGYTKGESKILGLKQLINTPVYRNYKEDRLRETRIKKVYDGAYEIARKEFLKSRGIK